MKKNIPLVVLQAALLVTVVYCVKFFKLSYVLGGTTAFFSGSNIVAPLAGAYGLSQMLALVYICTAYLTLGSISYTALVVALHLPTIAAALYWSSNSFVYRVGLPLVCMGAFLAHHAGSAAPFYALWWLVPVIAFFVARNSVFATALGSTYTAHAVGTLVWMYINPLTPELYAQLMPIVLVERLVYASGMTLVYYALKYVYALLTSMTFITKKA